MAGAYSSYVSQFFVCQQLRALGLTILFFALAVGRLYMKRNGWASCSGRGGVHFVTGCVAAADGWG